MKESKKINLENLKNITGGISLQDENGLDRKLDLNGNRDISKELRPHDSGIGNEESNFIERPKQVPVFEGKFDENDWE